MLSTVILFIISLAVLILASDKFIGAAEKIGLSFGISPFVIGVTIIAFGTSLPELATSIVSVMGGSSEIVLGNVIGSNITNILLVLGLTAVVAKNIVLDHDVMDVEMPLLFISAFLLWFALMDGQFTTFEAILFIAALIIFLTNSINSQGEESKDNPKAVFRDYFTLIIGGILVYFGAEFTVKGIEDIATMIGIDPGVISVTVLALGTSLPEVVVSLAATVRGNHAIAVGNVLGSNIFNTYAVMAIPSFFGKLDIPQEMQQVYLPFMLVVTFLFGLTCLSKRISKWEGMMLLVFYTFFIYQAVLSTNIDLN